MRNDVKLLFADMYRCELEIKDGLKEAAKLVTEMLVQGDWESLSKVINGIWDEAAMIEKQAMTMRQLAEKFIAAGDYPGQTIQMTPMESLARE